LEEDAVPEETVQLQDDGPDEPVIPPTEQHPALGGDPQAEIDSRTPGDTGPGEYRQTFVIDAIDIGDTHPMHAANKQATAQEAINRGMHPTEEARLIKSDEVRSSRRHTVTHLTYAVKVVPSVIDHHPERTVTPSDLVDSDSPAGPAVSPEKTATGRGSRRGSTAAKK
jgi:hypothetical protein